MIFQSLIIIIVLRHFLLALKDHNEVPGQYLKKKIGVNINPLTANVRIYPYQGHGHQKEALHRYF